MERGREGEKSEESEWGHRETTIYGVASFESNGAMEVGTQGRLRRDSMGRVSGSGEGVIACSLAERSSSRWAAQACIAGCRCKFAPGQEPSDQLPRDSHEQQPGGSWSAAG